MKKMMASSVLALAAGLAWAGPGHTGHEHGAADKQKVTVTGEVLDMACYMAHEAKGPKHQKCAKACLLGGAPMGLLTGKGEVYLLVGDHSDEKPYKAAIELAGMNAKVTGTVSRKGGVQALIVSSVQKG